METQRPHPPRLALRLFRWYCRPDRQEELEGDLEEFFSLRLASGTPLWQARAFFWWNVIRCYRPYAKTKTQNSMTIYPLFRSYFKLALRHSWKNKWSVLINVVGLGLALSMCIFVYTMYAYNIEFDGFYKQTDNIYRVHTMTQENRQVRRNELSPLPLDDKLRHDISGVQGIASYTDYGMSVKRGNNFFDERVGFVSGDFFKMFELPLKYGSFEEFEARPVAYLTENAATKLFGDDIALDEGITIYLNGTTRIDAIVAGVLKRIPENTSFDATIFLNYDQYLSALDINPNDWENLKYVSHYVRTDSEHLPLITRYMDGFISKQNEAHEERKITAFELVPFRSEIVANHLLSRSFTNSRLRPQALIIFTVLVSMVFLIACLNLANTSMALMAKRLKEIGIRKTLGSASKQILLQYLFEMGIIAALAFLVGLSTANFTSKAILGLFGGDFLLQDVDLTRIVIFMLAFLLFTTLVAGLLPALYAWRFQPAAIIRKSVKLKGVSWLNRALMIAQFCFSIAVLSAGITFTQNKVFLDHMDLGYQTGGIYVMSLDGNDKYLPLKQQVDQIPGITTAGTHHLVGQYGAGVPDIIKIDTARHEVRTYQVGEGYLELMKVAIATGRSFLSGSEADLNSSVLVNQEFARRYFEGKSPVNEVITLGDERRTIVGVTNDLIDDVYEDSEVNPTVLKLGGETAMTHLILDVSGTDVKGLESQLKNIWSEMIDQPYNGQLQEDFALGTAVRDSANLQKIFLTMAVLGGFLSLVGIFSLAQLNVARRVREISIRKVLGASLQQLLLVVNRSFFLILIISLLLGAALGYFISDGVLQLIYKHYVVVSPFTSLASGLLIVLFSALMVILAVLIPARGNPTNGLRQE